MVGHGSQPWRAHGVLGFEAGRQPASKKPLSGSFRCSWRARTCRARSTGFGLRRYGHRGARRTPDACRRHVARNATRHGRAPCGRGGGRALSHRASRSPGSTADARALEPVHSRMPRRLPCGMGSAGRPADRLVRVCCPWAVVAWAEHIFLVGSDSVGLQRRLTDIQTTLAYAGARV